MATVSQDITKAIHKLLDCSSRTLGLGLVFHDIHQRSGIDQKWQLHTFKCCDIQKRAPGELCTQFDVVEVHKELAGMPEGRIHVCPFGFTEIAVPVFSNRLYAGVIFAGPCWINSKTKKFDDLIVPSSKKWLTDRHEMVKAVAAQLGQLLLGEHFSIPDDRRRTILNFIDETMERQPTISELADDLKLSESRAGHVIKKLFAMTFPQLVQSTKMREACVILLETDLPIAEVAALVGHDDQNYFAYLFKKYFEQTPKQYREKSSPQA